MRENAIRSSCHRLLLSHSLSLPLFHPCLFHSLRLLFLSPSLSLPLLPLFLSSLRSSSIPEIGQKSNRVTNVNENIGGVHLGRRRIQQICSLTSELVRLNGSEEGKENLDDAVGQKNSPGCVYVCGAMWMCVCVAQVRRIVASQNRLSGVTGTRFSSLKERPQ